MSTREPPDAPAAPRDVAPEPGPPERAALGAQARIAGGLLGLLVGDAVGVPYEFKPPATLPPRDQIGHGFPPGFCRAHPDAPEGAWSDDGAHALCLLESLLHAHCLDPDDLARRLVNWYEHGYLAVDAQVFDVGVQTAAILRKIAAGVPWSTAAPSDDETLNGNGSLMRVLPLALWHQGSDAELVRDARLQSRVTHGHRRAQLCCALYCLWARRLLEGRAAAYQEATDGLYALVADEPESLHELEQHVRPRASVRAGGSGYVVDTLHSARVALEQPGYERVIQCAIAFGHDTDTTAAVAGGLAGIREGVDAIPASWTLHEDARRLVQPALSRLLAWRAPAAPESAPHGARDETS